MWTPRLANMLISPTIYEHSPNYLHWVFLIILFMRNIGIKQAKKKNCLGIMIRLMFKNSFHRSRQRCVLSKKVFWKNSQNSQENNFAIVSFLIKLQAYWCLTVNFAKFLRTAFWHSSSGWLLLLPQNFSSSN